MDDLLERIKEKTLRKWGEKTVSIAVFGSYVKRKKYKDIDVLIVLQDITKGRMERIGDIVELKRSIEFPLDIMLVSKKECLENFRSHNPIYLDIAMEGEIVYDMGFLKELINETKSYIERGNVKRVRSRWIFPVTDRIASTLSRITNKDWAQYWIEDAKRDFKAAESLLDAEIFERAVYHCQQAVEKVVKGLLICFGSYEKTHYVSVILKEEGKKRELGKWNERLEDIIKISEKLEPHVSLSRYPGISEGDLWLPYKEYTYEIAEKSLSDAKKAIKLAEEFVSWWFKEG
jgi:HEPN domain-containing protein/predicted nucleotidyltransferase